MPLPSPFTVTTTTVTYIRAHGQRTSINFTHNTSGTNTLLAVSDGMAAGRTVSTTVYDFVIGYQQSINANVQQNGAAASGGWQLIAVGGSVTVAVGETFMPGAQNA